MSIELKHIKVRSARDIEDDLQEILPQFSRQQIEQFCSQMTGLHELQVKIQGRDQSPDKIQLYTILRSDAEMQSFIAHLGKVEWGGLTGKQQVGKLFPKAGTSILLERQIFERDWCSEFLDSKARLTDRKIGVKLKKQSGGRYAQFERCFCLNWKEWRVYILKEGVATYDEKKDQVQEFMHFSNEFRWEVAPNLSDRQVFIHSYHRKLSLKADSDQDFYVFITYLHEYLKEYKSDEQHYEHSSFAPVREKNNVKFHVDGQDYFEALAKAIQSAKEEVFMCGWWISPEFSLIRGYDGVKKDYRLDLLLTRVAKKGVKIYIIVYYESKFLTNDSLYTMQTLGKLNSDNIKVLRHPQIVLPTYWSHHEKLVVVDQQTAFLGGLDICYGRFDTQEHLLNPPNGNKIYPGIEYNNCRVADFQNVRVHSKQNVPRTVPRLPWHDVALMVKGPAVKDLTRHFVEYWNYSSYQTHYADRYVLVPKRTIWQKIKNLKQRFSANAQMQEIPREGMTTELHSEATSMAPAFAHPDVQKSCSKESFGFKTGAPRPQKYSTNVEVTSKQLGHSYEPGTSVDSEPDTNMLSDQKREPVNDENNQQMKESIKLEKVINKQNDLVRIYAKVEEKIENEPPEPSLEREFIRERVQAQKKKQPAKQIRLFEKIKNALGQQKNNGITTTEEQMLESNRESHEQEFKCQVVRSASQWSIGCQSKFREKSIYNAYIDMIENAQHFIYIENQFFISATQENGTVKNKIMEAIYKRISNAHHNKQDFKVMVLMPLVPGFAGELDDPDASLPRVIMNWQYKTISRGGNSLCERIKQQLQVQPHRYVRFFGLRTHALMGDMPVTEIIYLHSKLMIVDDSRLICGSANINDRSMQGNRDSELCLIVEAKPDTNFKVEGKVYNCVKEIHDLRVKLWQEHFGIDEDKAAVPSRAWDQVSLIAQKNTEIYRELFGCYPDNNIKKLSQIQQFKEKTPDRDKYEKMTYKIKGNAVQFPLQFLAEEKLTSFHPHALST